MATTTKKSPKTSKAKKSTKTTKKPTRTSKKTTKQSAVKSVKQVAVKKTAPNSVFDKLNLWNLGLVLLHAGQGIAIILLSRSESLFPVTTNYLTTNTLVNGEGAPQLLSAQRNLFDVNLAYLVAAFFFMSAAAHLYIATIYRKKYEDGLSVGINRARWIEYGLSASTMMLAISMLVGVSDVSTLLLIFSATLVMNLLGLVMEVHNQTLAKTNWLGYIVGTIAGLVPWLVIGIYLIGANNYGSGQIPTFVYYIYGSIFVLFSSFAVNMYLQYKKKGRWSDYLYGEKIYMLLSLAAKSALAWQVFIGTLRP